MGNCAVCRSRHAEAAEARTKKKIKMCTRLPPKVADIHFDTTPPGFGPRRKTVPDKIRLNRVTLAAPKCRLY